MTMPGTRAGKLIWLTDGLHDMRVVAFPGPRLIHEVQADFDAISMRSQTDLGVQSKVKHNEHNQRGSTFTCTMMFVNYCFEPDMSTDPSSPDSRTSS